jgi:WD40 repeat protein
MLVAGRYLLSEAVGQGGMGRVWRGHDQLLDRVVAVKEVVVPSQSPTDRAEFLARTMREARAAARLDHPGVITIHDVVEHEGSPWIVMQFVSGESLRARIDRDGRLPWQQVADIGGQVAEALAAAHAAGIVHRDLKPDNILLSGRRAIVTDFGIARIVDDTTQLTGTGVRIGTPLYMAPENLDGGAVGPGADMWALGATLYVAVEGMPPFSGPTMTALIAAILTRPPVRPEHAGPLLEMLGALLSKDPVQRPDARAAARGLAAFRVGQAAMGSTTGHGPSPADTAANLGLPHPPTAAAVLEDPRGTGFRNTQTGGWHRPDDTGDAFTAAHVAQPFPPFNGHPSFPDMARAAAPPAPLHPDLLGLRPASGKVRWRPGVRSVLVVVAIAAAAAVTGTILGLPGGSRSPGTASPPGPGPAGATKAALIATLTEPGQELLSALAFGPNGLLATGNDDGRIYLWNTTTKKVAATFTDPHSQGVFSMAFAPDGTLAVGDGNGNTYLWDTITQSVTSTLTNPDGEDAHAVAFAPDGTLAVAGTNFDTGASHTYLWNTATGSLITTLTDPNGQGADAVAFAPDGTLAVGDANGNTYLWDTAAGSVTTTLADPDGEGVSSVAFASDGTLAAGDRNGSTYLWDTAAESVTATLTDPNRDQVASVAFAPGHTLAVGDNATGAILGGSNVGSTYLWNTATGSLTATLPVPNDGPPYLVEFGPDGTLAVGNGDGYTCLWRIPSDES